LKSDTFTACLQAVQQTAATNAPAVTAVAAWMAANHLLAEDINWLTHLPVGVRSQPQVRLALADAYLQNSDWQKLRDFASHGSWNDLEFLRLAIVSRAWSQLGNSAVGDTTWGAAVSEAGNHFGALTTLLGLTEQWKLPRERVALLQLIVKKFPHERWAQQTLAQFYYDAGNTLALHQLYARLFGQFPKETSFKNNLAATALLLKTNLVQANQWAKEVYAEAPNNPDAAATYAFALHLQDRDQDGLAVLQKLKPAQLEQPSIALYYGLLLAATGKNAEAAAYFQIAQTQGRLLPEEKQLLTEALAK
jgi:Flp pilus assembly protein TadD